VTWNTTDINGTKLTTVIYSLPAATVSVEKFWGRFGGYEEENEREHPIIRFQSSINTSYRRMTIISTHYSSDTGYNITNISGGVMAATVKNGTWNDTVAVGDGTNMTFSSVTTDATALWIRENTSGLKVFAENVSFLNVSGSVLVDSPTRYSYYASDATTTTSTMAATTTTSTMAGASTTTTLSGGGGGGGVPPLLILLQELQRLRRLTVLAQFLLGTGCRLQAVKTLCCFGFIVVAVFLSYFLYTTKFLDKTSGKPQRRIKKTGLTLFKQRVYIPAYIYT